MNKFYMLLLCCFCTVTGYSQTGLITPTNSGGFENTPTGFANNFWTAVNGGANPWVVGTGTFIGSKGAYIGTPTTYTATNTFTINHFYRSGNPAGTGIVIPAGATNVSLSFRYKQPVADPGGDSLIASISPNSASVPAAGTTVGPAYTRIYYNTATAYAGYTNVGPIDLTAYAGTSIRLAFTYVNNGSGAIGVPAIDSVALYYCDTTTGNGSICSGGGNTTLTNNTNGSGGVWTSSNPSIANIGTTTATTASIIGGSTTGTATITYTIGSCQVKRVVTVNQQPSAISGATTLCEGSTIPLSSSPSGGIWSSSVTAHGTVDASGNVTGITAGTTTISYVLGTCQSTKVVTVATQPGTITGSHTVCASGGTTALADAPSGGSWFSTIPTNASISTSGIVTGNVAGTTTIFYVLGSCSASAIITVDPLPSAITGLYSVCEGGAMIALSDATPGGTWASGSPLNASVDGFGNVTGNSAGTATMSYTAGGCSATAVITVNALPVIYNVTGGGSFCASGSGADVGLDGSDLGIDYDLYNGTTLIGSLSGTGSSIDFGLFAVPGTYVIQATDASTLCSTGMAGSAALSVASPVVPSVGIAPVSLLTCTGNSITVVATPVNGGPGPAYEWIINGTSMGMGSDTYTYTPTDGDIVKVILYPGGICTAPLTATHTYTVTVMPFVIPSVSIAINPGNPGCIGNPVTFSAVPVNGGSTPTYRWTKNGINVATGPDFICVPLSGDILYCTMFSSYACRSADSVFSSDITMSMASGFAAPTVSIAAYPGLNISAGQRDSLVATVSGAGAGSVSYLWYVNGAPVGGATSNTFVSTTLADLDVVTCKVTNSDACARSTLKSVNIHVGSLYANSLDEQDEQFFIYPNPNKGIFNIKGTLSTTDEELSVEIANMLGQNVYSNKIRCNKGLINCQVLLNNMPDGLYSLKLYSETVNKVSYFIIH